MERLLDTMARPVATVMMAPEPGWQHWLGCGGGKPNGGAPTHKDYTITEERATHRLQ